MVDRIDQFRAFAAVVASGSFTAAARRLDVTPQLVSKYVKALEETLQARLLNRTTRSAQLTETGRAFFERATRLLDDFDELCASASADHGAPRGRLRVTAPANFGELHVVPIIARYLDAYPETSVDLNLSDRHVSLVDEGFDVAIRIGALESSGLIARRLADAPIVLCASPAYLAEAGRPSRPSDLAAHACVLDANLQDPELWRFVVDGAPVAVRVSGRFRVNSATAVRRRVLSGGGVALCPHFVVRDDIAAGALETVLDGAVALSYSVYAVYLESRHLSGKIRAFVDFTAEALRSGRGEF